MITPNYKRAVPELIQPMDSPEISHFISECFKTL
jgi:hypothetical protein